jgi:hypothetical protein
MFVEEGIFQMDEEITDPKPPPILYPSASKKLNRLYKRYKQKLTNKIQMEPQFKQFGFNIPLRDLQTSGIYKPTD